MRAVDEEGLEILREWENFPPPAIVAIGMEARTDIGTVRQRIFLIRGQRVMLDADLAAIYGVSTGQLNQAVRRNRRRFPRDFMFRLSCAETRALKSQSVISKPGRGGSRHCPAAFTEHGAVMLSSVLHSRAAIDASLLIARAFVGLRRMVTAHKELARSLAKLEKQVSGHDAEIRGIIDAIQELIEGPPQKHPKIGFRP